MRTNQRAPQTQAVAPTTAPVLVAPWWPASSTAPEQKPPPPQHLEPPTPRPPPPATTITTITSSTPTPSPSSTTTSTWTSSPRPPGMSWSRPVGRNRGPIRGKVWRRCRRPRRDLLVPPRTVRRRRMSPRVRSRRLWLSRVRRWRIRRRPPIPMGVVFRLVPWTSWVLAWTSKKIIPKWTWSRSRHWRTPLGLGMRCSSRRIRRRRRRPPRRRRRIQVAGMAEIKIRYWRGCWISRTMMKGIGVVIIGRVRGRRGTKDRCRRELLVVVVVGHLSYRKAPPVVGAIICFCR